MPRHLIPGNDVFYCKSWPAYVERMAYPLDIEMDDPVTTFEKAINGSEEVAEWRTRMIGKPFDADKFLYFLATYLEEV